MNRVAQLTRRKPGSGPQASDSEGSLVFSYPWLTHHPLLLSVACSFHLVTHPEALSAATAVVPGFPLVWRRFGDNSSQSIQHRGRPLQQTGGSMHCRALSGARGPASHPGEGSGIYDPEPQGGSCLIRLRLIRSNLPLHAQTMCPDDSHRASPGRSP